MSINNRKHDIFMSAASLKNSRGVGLIEVLVTMLLLSTALLTLASLQTRSLQYNQGAYFRSQANILAYDMLDRIRINKAHIGSYSLALSPLGNTAPVTAPLEAADMYEWRKDVDSRLPSAEAGIACDASMICTVTIKWGELNSANAADEETTTFEYKSRI